MVLTKRSWTLPLICQVCGDRARGMNFEVMTCMSCKAFFRRHALEPVNVLVCPRNNNCEITRVTRGNCSSCRLRKCFALGMNSKLIRSQLKNDHKSLKTRHPRLPPPTPLNLLQRDTSTLTREEWDLLSNIIHAYDQEKSIETAKQLLNQQSSLLPKLRTKPKTTMNIISYYYKTVQAYLSHVRFYNHLSMEARQALIQHNYNTVGSLNSIYIVRETDAVTNSSYAIGCSNIYGCENFSIFKDFISKLEKNGTLIKVMLIIAAFAGNCSIVSLARTESMEIMTTTVNLVQIQSTLVTMFWKYLVYQYGFSGAVKCFDSLIKYILNIMRWTEAYNNTNHSHMLDSVVDDTTRLLIRHS